MTPLQKALSLWNVPQTKPLPPPPPITLPPTASASTSSAASAAAPPSITLPPKHSKDVKHPEPSSVLGDRKSEQDWIQVEKPLLRKGVPAVTAAVPKSALPAPFQTALQLLLSKSGIQIESDSKKPKPAPRPPPPPSSTGIDALKLITELQRGAAEKSGDARERAKRGRSSSGSRSPSPKRSRQSDIANAIAVITGRSVAKQTTALVPAVKDGVAGGKRYPHEYYVTSKVVIFSSFTRPEPPPWGAGVLSYNHGFAPVGWTGTAVQYSKMFGYDSVNLGSNDFSVLLTNINFGPGPAERAGATIFIKRVDTHIWIYRNYANVVAATDIIRVLPTREPFFTAGLIREPIPYLGVPQSDTSTACQLYQIGTGFPPDPQGIPTIGLYDLAGGGAYALITTQAAPAIQFNVVNHGTELAIRNPATEPMFDYDEIYRGTVPFKKGLPMVGYIASGGTSAVFTQVAPTPFSPVPIQAAGPNSPPEMFHYKHVKHYDEGGLEVNYDPHSVTPAAGGFDGNTNPLWLRWHFDATGFMFNSTALNTDPIATTQTAWQGGYTDYIAFRVFVHFDDAPTELGPDGPDA